MTIAIDDEATAKRLARALLSDVWLYNEDKIKQATDVRIAIAEELREARALFTSRVSPNLAPVFEAQLAEWLAKHGQPVEPGTDPLPPFAGPPPSTSESESESVSRFEQLGRREPAPREASGSTLIIAVLLVLVVTLAGALIFVLH